MGCDRRNDDGDGGFPPDVGLETFGTYGETVQRHLVVMAVIYHGSGSDRFVADMEVL